MIEKIADLKEEEFPQILDLMEKCFANHKIKPCNIYKIIDYISYYRLNKLKIYYSLFETIYKKYPVYLHHSLFALNNAFMTIISRKLNLNWTLNDFVYKNFDVEDIFEVYEKDSILHAVLFDNYDVLYQFLIMKDFNIDLSYEGNTLINHCAKHGSINCFRFLYVNNAKFTIRTLEDAFYGGNTEIIHMLEQNFAANQKCINNAVEAHHNDIVFYLEDKYDLQFSWTKCTLTYNLGMFLNKLCSNADVNAPDNGGFIAFPSCSRFCIPSLINLLLEKGAKINARDFNKMTALDHAAVNNCAEIAKILISKKVEVNDTAIFKVTPLMFCAANNSADVAKILIENGANLDFKDSAGATALHYSAQMNSYHVAKILLQHGADVEIYCDNSKTPLMNCAQYDAVDVAKLLIGNGAMIDAQDKFKHTTLMICAIYDSVKTAHLLLSKGANTQMKNINNATALMLSVDNDSKEVQKLITEYEANIKIKIF